jgi:N-methylhydantoinase B
MEKGQEGSCNRAEVLRKDGSVETYSMITGLKGAKGDVFRLISGTGGGYGDPCKRDRAKVETDIRDGYVTLDQAIRDYGFQEGNA